MAQKVFKGFMQVTEGTFEAQTGYIYFVRNSANTGHTDGYILFNGKKYGTAAEAAADLNADVEALESALGTLSGRVDAIETGYTTNATFNAYTAATDTALGAVSGRVDVLEASAATKEELGTLSGRVDVLETSAATKTEVGTLSGRVDALEAISADTRLDALEAVSADTRIAALEEDAAALSASTRLTALEASAHTHANKTVLDGISQEKVDAWDSMAGGANVVLSAYTGSDAGVTDGFLKSYEIFQGGVSKGKIDIPKDMVVTSGVITANTNDEKVLRLTIANQSEPVDILVSDLVDVYTAGDGIEISTGNTVSAKVVEANGLSVDSNGIAMALADGSNAGAMSAADFTKLGTIDASAQTNVIEEIKVDGTALTVDNKSVNIDLSGKADNTTVGTLSGRVDALEAVSADTRLDALEELSGASHTHANQSVLDGISSEDVAGWDAAEQNAKDYADGLKNGLNADVSGDSNGVEVRVQQVSGVVTDVTVTAPDFANTYAPIGVTSADTRLNALEAISGQSHTHDNKAVLDTLTAESAATWNNVAGSASTWNDVASSASTWNGVAGSADTRISALEASAATWNNVADSADTRLDVIEGDYLTSADKTELENALSAETTAREALADRVDSLEAVSADTRLNALEALTGDTSSALQSISAGDASVTVGTKSNNDQSVAVAVSSTANNALSLENDGLFAAIYYDGDDSD